ARFADRRTAAVGARDQRRLGGGERDVELSLGVKAAHRERSDHAHRDLGDADEVFAVALARALHVERMVRDVVQLRPGEPFDRLAADVARLLGGEVPGQLMKMQLAGGQSADELVVARAKGCEGGDSADHGHRLSLIGKPESRSRTWNPGGMFPNGAFNPRAFVPTAPGSNPRVFSRPGRTSRSSARGSYARSARSPAPATRSPRRGSDRPFPPAALR